MSTGFNVIGDSSLIGNLSLNTAKPNGNTYSVINFNSMTTAQRGSYTSTGPTIIYDNQLLGWYLHTSAGAGVLIPPLAPDLGIAANTAVAANDTRIVPLTSIPQRTFLGRQGPAGTGPVQQISTSTQFNFTGSTVDLVQPLNRLNGMTSVLNYQLWNDGSSANSTSTVEVTLKFITITASTFLVDGDGVSGEFAGTFVTGLATTSTIRIYVNTVLVAERVISTSPSGTWRAEFNVMRYQSNGIRASAEIVSDIGGGISNSDTGFNNIVFTNSNPFNIELRAVNSVVTNSVNCALVNCVGGKNI